MKLKAYLAGFIILSLSLASCSQYNRIQKSNDYQKKLAFANKLYKEEKYNKAQLLYSQVKDAFKGTKQYEQLFYNYAYTYYYMKDYESAAFYFKNFVQAFPNSSKTEEMDYMQAYCFYKLSPRVELDQANTIKAISAMQTFINIYPNSKRVKEGTEIIDKCRAKLELKEYKAAKLYYDLGYYKAAGVTFSNLLLDYPDSEDGDKYKFLSIKSYYKYADKSVITKQKERYQTVITQYLSFEDFYPNSQYLKEAASYYTLAKQNIQSLEHESTKKNRK